MTDTPVRTNRWVRREPRQTSSLGDGPLLPSLEAVYLTDPELLAELLPPPLAAPPEPRVHVRITDIDLDVGGGHRYQEKVGFFAVDAIHEETLGEYPLLIPIDLEGAISISRERHGEPKKLAELELERHGDHIEGRISRQGVTFVEMIGDVSQTLPTPEPYPATQFWYKFLPAVQGEGFDGGVFLVRVDQVRSPQSVEAVAGKVVLRDLASAPVADLPVHELVSMTWTKRRSTVDPKVACEVDPQAFAPFAAARYDHW